MRPDFSRMIPGDWAKAESGWLAWPFYDRLARFGRGGRIHQFLWRRSRAVGKRELGTERKGAMRNRSDSSQLTQASFELEPIAVTQRVIGCYCASARANDSGGLSQEVSQTKDAERRDKLSVRTRGGHAVWAGPVKTFRGVGDVKNDTADL